MILYLKEFLVPPGWWGQCTKSCHCRKAPWVSHLRIWKSYYWSYCCIRNRRCRAPSPSHTGELCLGKSYCTQSEWRLGKHSISDILEWTMTQLQSLFLLLPGLLESGTCVPREKSACDLLCLLRWCLMSQNHCPNCCVLVLPKLQNPRGA